MGVEMKYAVITGATQGIGKATTELLLENGFSVAICARNNKLLSEYQRQWQEKYPEQKIIAQRTDMGETEDIRTFVTTIGQQFPQVDILINNAGVFLPGSLADEPEGNLETLMN